MMSVNSGYEKRSLYSSGFLLLGDSCGQKTCPMAARCSKEKAITWDTFIALVAPELVVAKALLNHCNSGDFWCWGWLGEETKVAICGRMIRGQVSRFSYVWLYLIYYLLACLCTYLFTFTAREGERAFVKYLVRSPSSSDSYKMWPSATKSLQNLPS